MCWAYGPEEHRRRALTDAWGAANRSTAATAAAAPTRFPHQQQLMDLIHEHLTAAEQRAAFVQQHGAALAATQPWAYAANGEAGAAGAGAGVPPPPRPLKVIMSTPTGSGKTFTAVMLVLQLLRPDDKAGRAGHPGTILVYSVPTKQVRVRVCLSGFLCCGFDSVSRTHTSVPTKQVCA